MTREEIKAEITGMVVKIIAHEGTVVSEEEQIIILEAMKMEVPVLAPADGTVLKILVAEGEEVAEGQALAVLES